MSTDEGASGRPATGRQLRIAAGAYAATVTEVGAHLRELRHGGDDLVDPFPAPAMPGASRGAVLAPWPNRIRDGRYAFAGEEQQLPLSEPKRHNAIHGLVRWVPWRVESHSAAAARLAYELPPQPGYHGLLELVVDYALDADTGLTVRLTATNVGSAPAPYGAGFHPYLTVGVAPVDGCRLTVPAGSRLTVDAQQIPVGREQVEGTAYDLRGGPLIGDRRLDDCFGDMQRDAGGRAWASLAGPDGRAVSLWCDPTLPWLMVFTMDLPGRPSRRAVAVEPMTCPPNAFVSGEDLVALEPGRSHGVTWGITAGSPG